MTAILDRATFALGPSTNQCPNPKNEKSLKEYEKRGGLGRGGVQRQNKINLILLPCTKWHP